MKTKLEATRRVAIGMALFAIMTIAVIGCKNEPEPEPVPQSKTIEGLKNSSNVAVTVTINYTASPGSVPIYISNLEEAIKDIFNTSAKTGPLTINVISGNNSFAILDGVLTVGASQLAGKNKDEIVTAISPVFNSWTT